MLLGLVADIHANALALTAVLTQLKALGAGRLVFLGDIVGYGADPQETVDVVRGHVEAGAAVVRGNHDEAVTISDDFMNDVAREAIDWTRGRLDRDSQSWLGGLALTSRLEDVLAVHAEASAPAEWIYVTTPESARRSLAAAKAAVTFCGHVHRPALYGDAPGRRMIARRPATGAPSPLGGDRRWLAVIGSAGQPRDGNPAAAFATYNTESRTLVFRRAAYDVDLAASRVLRAGLPERLAARLVRGE